MKFIRVTPRNRKQADEVINLDTVTRVRPHPMSPAPDEEQTAHFYFVDGTNLLTTMSFEYAGTHLTLDGDPSEC